MYREREGFINAGKQGLNDKGSEGLVGREMARLQGRLGEREQGIGELTIANWILKKLSVDSA